MQYQHLFFDLDHTLWDFDANSNKALTFMYYEFDFRQYGIVSPEQFIETYLPINYKAWDDYTSGLIDAYTVKTKRFADTLAKFSVINEGLAARLDEFYLRNLPLGGIAMPNAHRVLEKLKENYPLHLVTNGFTEVTTEKLRHATLSHLFDSILTAEEAGALKPDPKVFLTALEQAGAEPKTSLFIGDNLKADVQGAKNVGIDQVYFNPHKQNHNEQPTYEIAHLDELLPILNV